MFLRKREGMSGEFGKARYLKDVIRGIWTEKKEISIKKEEFSQRNKSREGRDMLVV